MTTLALSPELALSRLRDPQSPAVKNLARLCVTAVLDTPFRDGVDWNWVAARARTTLQALTDGPRPEGSAKTLIHQTLDAQRTDVRPVGHWLPGDVRSGLSDILARPWSPDEALVHRLLDQPAVRQLVSEVLEDSLTRFQRRLRSLDTTGLGALGARAARRGRGLLDGVAQNLGGLGLTSLTEGIVGAVAEELEHAVQQRITDYVSSATGEAIRAAARHIANPQHAAAYGRLRAGALDVLLDLPISRAVDELDKMDPDALTARLWADLRKIANEPEWEQRLASDLLRALDHVPYGTLGEALDAFGVRGAWESTLCDAFVTLSGPITESEAFAAWWRQLFTP